MKKLIAATLLSIYLFNIGGQLVLHQYFEHLSDKFFAEQTSKGLYNLNDLTEVKIPVNMPGVADWPTYENITGQIQFENVSYNYVKMRITRHVMYLMCVPNYKTTQLTSQNIIGAKGVKDAPVSKKDHIPYGKTTLLAQFSFAFIQYTFNSPFKSTEAPVMQPVQQIYYRSASIPEQPPRSAC